MYALWVAQKYICEELIGVNLVVTKKEQTYKLLFFLLFPNKNIIYKKLNRSMSDFIHIINRYDTI